MCDRKIKNFHVTIYTDKDGQYIHLDMRGEVMGGFLLVPIHLDALCLETDISVVGAKCDFTRLPYWDGEREVNPDIANISEELLSIPFQDRGLQLRAGVHLHWALPDALTKGMPPLRIPARLAISRFPRFQIAGW